jgi:choline dehydrogenase-like flavoprotein
MVSKLSTEIINEQAPCFPDDRESLPAGSVVEGQSTRKDVSDIADYVIVGTGAAGASAAVILSSAGYSVILIEEGPWVRTRDLSADMLPGLSNMVRGMATNVALGKAPLAILQGRCVGGSTAINSAIAWRPPESVLMRWSREFGLGETLSPSALEPHFQEIERVLNVRAVEDRALGESNRLFGEAAKKLGIRADRIMRYESGCEGSGLCLTGCMTARKLSMNVTHVPETLRKGGKIYTSARVERIESERGRASAVVARLQSPRKPRLRAFARRGILVAASALQTPGVLARTGLRSRHVGRHFQAHPGISLSARFERPVRMQFGATQGMNSLHFAESRGFKLETVSLPPELAVMRMPGVGTELIGRVMDYDYLAAWAVVVRAEAEGRVLSIFGRDVPIFNMTTADVARMRDGMKVLSEMMFATGAREVWPGVYGMPTALKSPDDLKAWDSASLDPRAYSPMASHLFGSARMGRDPSKSVVSTGFEAHELSGLYVVDSSVFPTNLGVNPQHTIMAVARLAATRIAESSRLH